MTTTSDENEMEAMMDTNDTIEAEGNSDGKQKVNEEKQGGNDVQAMKKPSVKCIKNVSV